MPRLLPFGLLLPLSLPTLAQQPDTLAARRVGVAVVADSLPLVIPDVSSLLSGHLSCGFAGVIIQRNPLSPYLSIQEQLRQVAGVQASPYSGAPWAQAVVRIRGAASLSSNAQPLYVVDGVPVFQNTFQAPVSGSSAGFLPAEATELDVNPLLSLPTEDIELVEVLKGALGTARYGSQGLNGVISITTRRGAAGPLRVNYSGYGGVQRTRQPYELLNAQQYAALANEAASAAGQPAPFSAAQVAAFGQGTDWQDEVLRTAAVQEHHLSAQGGKARTRYYASADYLSNRGIIVGSSLTRYAARAAVEQGIGQKLRLSAQAGISQTSQRLPLHSTVEWALINLPTAPVRNPDGTFFTASQLGRNAVQLAEENYQTPRQRRLLAQALAQYTLLPGLTAEMRVNLEQAGLQSSSYRPAFGTLPGGLREEYEATYRQWVLNPALRYSRSLQNGRHVVDASLEAFRQARTEEYKYTEFFLGPDLGPSGKSTMLSSTRVDAYRLEAGYTLAGRYQVQGSLRRDGSGVFGLDNRWEWLPGAQLTWHAGQEDFLKGHSILDRLDVWAGWGRTSGSGNIGRNSTSTPLFTPNGFISTAVFLREPTQQLEAGVTANLWQSKLQLTGTAYTRRTSTESLVVGLTQFFASNELRNRGVELTIASSWQAGSVAGTSSLAAAVNQNRYQQNSHIDFLTLYQRLVDKQTLSTFYGARYLGVDGNGQPRFEDKNGDGQIRFEDYQPLGSGLPRQLLSFGQQVSFKRFSLQAQLDGQFGYQIHNTLLPLLERPNGATNGTTRLLDRWTSTNPTTNVPAANQRLQLPSVSTYTLQSGNHVRLTSLTFTYKVWEKEARNFSVWMGGYNLFVLTKYRGYDPNISSAGSDNRQAGVDTSSYPTARTVVLGVRATL
ncbi:SusC/RagA family TonB-linked outer membrane protein [Hymenobacter weizhouensis]|nr:SusC/RagA family TonB-linked outer membrane protein [Hymenobacter sp. YIM 151500-1]